MFHLPLAAVPAPDSGDQETVARVYTEHIDPVYRFIYRRVGNREEAEDLTAQVFLKAVRFLDGSRDDLAVKSWLFQLARTTLADHWRQYYRAPRVSLELITREAATPEADPGEDSGAAETLRQVLSILPQHYQRVLTLRFLEGLSIKEAAAEMGITEGNVKVLQLRALRRAAEKGRHLL